MHESNDNNHNSNLNVSTTWEIRTSDCHGKGMYATRDMAAGSVVLEETPLIYCGKTSDYHTVVWELTAQVLQYLPIDQLSNYARKQDMSSTWDSNDDRDCVAISKKLNIDKSTILDVHKMVVANNITCVRQCTGYYNFGFYKTLSFVNHSCKPNSELVTKSFRSGAKMLQTIAPIKQGEEITFSYVSETDPPLERLNKPVRKRFLYQIFDFQCNCVLCR